MTLTDPCDFICDVTQSKKKKIKKGTESWQYRIVNSAYYLPFSQFSVRSSIAKYALLAAEPESTYSFPVFICVCTFISTARKLGESGVKCNIFYFFIPVAKRIMSKPNVLCP